MPILSLPLSFNNSFWSQDYRRGLETVHAKLVQGVEENAELVAFVRARARAELAFSASLITPELTGPQGRGFGADDGASLLVAFRGLQAESVAQGEAHRGIARDLEILVADPFEAWAAQHERRITETKRTLVDGWLRSYEEAAVEVAKLKQVHLNKTRRADEVEDDAKFAPNNDIREKYTTSPRLGPTRTGSVSDRITRQLREKLGQKSLPPIEISNAQSPPATETGHAPTKLDKGKGKEIISPEPGLESPVPLSPPLPPLRSPTRFNTNSSVIRPPPPPMLLAGLAMAPAAVSNLLGQAQAELPLKPVRFPILGEYEDTFTGEEFTTWLKDRVPGFGGSLDRAEDAARELTERDNVLRRLGELGNKFENSRHAFYQFRDKAFELHEIQSYIEDVDDSKAEPSALSLAPTGASLLKRSNTFASYIAKSLNTNGGEPPYIKARMDADAADSAYKSAIRTLDMERLALEDRIEANLKLWNRWEAERLRAVKTVLLQYQGTLSGLTSATAPSLERSSMLISTFQPETDLVVAIERYRTGPFRPTPQVYKSVGHVEQTDVVFGIDLRSWAGEGGWHAVRAGAGEKDDIPNVLKGLLAGLKQAYQTLPSDAERRKAWIYEVPLPSQHQLREALNNLPGRGPMPLEVFARFDAPVIASTLKLWLLELDPPLGLWEGWDDVKKIYPSVGAHAHEDRSVVEDLKLALARWPKVHLLALNAVVGHIKELIDTTEVEEPTDVFTNKIALSLGRTIIRPKTENQITIQDRHATLLFIDLLDNYAQVIPPTIAKKKRDSERPVVTKKRTAPVDLRLHRSSLSGQIDPQKLLEVQMELQHGGRPRSSSRAPSPAPPRSPPITEPTVIIPVQPEVVPTEPEVIEVIEVAPPAEKPALVPEPTPIPEPAAPPPREPTPPRFAEPDPDAPPPRPTFKEPEPEDDEFVPPPSVIVAPPSPAKPITIPEPEPTIPSPPPPVSDVRVKSRSPTPTSPPGSRSATPSSTARGDEVLASARSSLTRSSSSMRGPRVAGARGPRPASVASPISPSSPRTGNGRTQSSISSLRSMYDKPQASEYAPRKRGGAVASSAFAGRGHLATRSMASGSEDETVGKND